MTPHDEDFESTSPSRRLCCLDDCSPGVRLPRPPRSVEHRRDATQHRFDHGRRPRVRGPGDLRSAPRVGACSLRASIPAARHLGQYVRQAHRSGAASRLHRDRREDTQGRGLSDRHARRRGAGRPSKRRPGATGRFSRTYPPRFRTPRSRSRRRRRPRTQTPMDTASSRNPRARAGTYADTSKRTCPRTRQMLDINSVKDRKIYSFFRV